MYLTKRLVNGIIYQFGDCDFLLLLFLWSPSWFKDKEKKSRSDYSSLRDFYLLDLGYSALYLLDILVYKVYDAVVVFAVLVLQATALDDFHCF